MIDGSSFGIEPAGCFRCPGTADRPPRTWPGTETSAQKYAWIPSRSGRLHSSQWAGGGGLVGITPGTRTCGDSAGPRPRASDCFTRIWHDQLRHSARSTAVTERPSLGNRTGSGNAPNADLVRPRHDTARMADQMQIRSFCLRQHDRHRGMSGCSNFGVGRHPAQVWSPRAQSGAERDPAIDNTRRAQK